MVCTSLGRICGSKLCQSVPKYGTVETQTYFFLREFKILFRVDQKM